MSSPRSVAGSPAGVPGASRGSQVRARFHPWLRQESVLCGHQLGVTPCALPCIPSSPCPVTCRIPLMASPWAFSQGHRP